MDFVRSAFVLLELDQTNPLDSALNTVVAQNSGPQYDCKTSCGDVYEIFHAVLWDVFKLEAN